MDLNVPASVRSLLLLTNSGSRRALEIRLQLESYLIDLPDTIEIIWKDVFTSPDPHLTADRAVIVGGDGTVNLGLSWLNSSGLDVPVALVPAGTGNNLARGLGIPIEPAEAIELAFCTDETRCIDGVQLTYDEKTTGMMLQVAAAGMPALVAQRFDRLRHIPILSHPVRWIGDSFYRLLALHALSTAKGRNFLWSLDLDGESLEVSGSALFFGNEGTIGGGFTPCPKAKIDDGLLDVCLLPTLSFRKSLELFKQVSSGSHLENRSDILYRQCRRVVLKQTRHPFLVDGDISGIPQKIELECAKGRVELVLPGDTTAELECP